MVRLRTRGLIGNIRTRGVYMTQSNHASLSNRSASAPHAQQSQRLGSAAISDQLGVSTPTLRKRDQCFSTGLRHGIATLAMLFNGLVEHRNQVLSTTRLHRARPRVPCAFS